MKKIGEITIYNSEKEFELLKIHAETADRVFGGLALGLCGIYIPLQEYKWEWADAKELKV